MRRLTTEGTEDTERGRGAVGAKEGRGKREEGRGKRLTTKGAKTADYTDVHGLNYQLEFNGGRVFQPAL